MEVYTVLKGEVESFADYVRIRLRRRMSARRSIRATTAAPAGRVGTRACSILEALAILPRIEICERRSDGFLVFAAERGQVRGQTPPRFGIPDLPRVGQFPP
jgi:hypothetical protein